MRILLVGSGGFLGTWVKNKIKDYKNYELVEIKGKQQLDITDLRKVDSYFKKNNPNIVINCSAFVGGISYGYKYPAKMLSINSQMALNLYKISADYNVEKLINPISNCAYPEHLTTYRESELNDGPPHISVYNYAKSKRLFVDLGKSYFDEYNFSSVNVVLSNMYGPFDHFDEERSHALGALVKKICQAKLNNFPTVTIWGTGKPIREWLYVEDGAMSLLKAIDLDEGHHFFNFGVEKGISIIDLAELIRSEVGWEGKFVFDKSKPDGVLEKKVDGNHGTNLIKYSPDTTLVDGISKTVQWYMKNYESS